MTRRLNLLHTRLLMLAMSVVSGCDVLVDGKVICDEETLRSGVNGYRVVADGSGNCVQTNETAPTVTTTKPAPIY